MNTSSPPRERPRPSPIFVTSSEEQLAELSGHVEAMAGDGLRVLAVAKASFAGDLWPSSQHDFHFEFLGLIGLADPIRAEVPKRD